MTASVGGDGILHNFGSRSQLPSWAVAVIRTIGEVAISLDGGGDPGTYYPFKSRSSSLRAYRVVTFLFVLRTSARLQPFHIRRA